ncbi:MAG: penicillin-binding protein 2 [Armatimonadota bacterium]
MSVLHAPRRPEVDRRMVWFPSLILPAFAVLVGRLWYIQVAKGDEFRDQAQVSRMNAVKKLAPRGAIFDRRGNLVAGVKGEIVVTMRPSSAKKYPEVVAKLAKILNLTSEEILHRISKESWRDNPAPIVVGLSVETATVIAETPHLTGVEIEEKSMRNYLDSTHFSHLMGYVWTPSEKDVDRITKKGVEPAEYVGKEGVERAYELDLMGTPGRELTEKRGKNKLTSEEAAVPGKQLFLSIDAGLQAYAQDLMIQRRFKGAIAAVEPTTGEVLVLVSNPTFDTKLFEGGISTANWKMLNDPDNSQPFQNRAIASQYEPGSTYKIVTTIAAYRAGKLDRGTYAFCNGGYSYGKNRSLKCLGVHGSIGYVDAMAKSCNTYFCALGIRAGTEQMRQTALDMGLGTKSGIEILGESKGIVPTQEWLDARRRKWYVGSLGNMSVGQGDINATPLQMANVAAMVANRGKIYKPHLVRAMRDSISGDTTYVQPELLHEISADDWLWDLLRDGLGEVINKGTAQSAKINGVSWCGKTGSAEHGFKGQNLTHGWFVGFAPRENPKIAICVLAENAGHGGDVAAPIAREIVSHWLLKSNKAASNSLTAASGSKVGSLTASR